MLNRERHGQFLALMAERGWDLLLFYGDNWRKDLFRCLVNVNFQGPQAVAALFKSGEIRAIVTDAWDLEPVAAAVAGKVSVALQLADGLDALLAKESAAVVAINGMEHMEARFVQVIRDATKASPVSATLDVEEIRRVKTPEEIGWIERAAELADSGYRQFVKVCEPGMTEYELVAEVEAFVKANGAEDNFMLVASGGTEVTGMKPPTARKFLAGDSVTTELTPQVNGYYAQICRTLVIGKPSDKQLQAYSIFAAAQQAAQDLLRPGVDIADVARVQNDVFRKHGFGEYTGPQYTRVRGHNLGLYPDELPHVLENVHYVVKKDMVLIAHPNTYLPLSGYMVFGDTLRVNENLTRLARLYVERDRVRRDRMRALQIAEFNQLMAHKPRIAVGDRQVSFALLNRDTGRASVCLGAKGIHQARCAERGSVVEEGFTLCKFCHRAADDQSCAQCLRLASQMQCDNRGVDNGVFNDQQATRQIRAQVRLKLREFTRRKYPAGDTTLGEPDVFPLSLGHFFFIRGHPQCSGSFVLGGSRQRRAQRLP